MGKFSGNYLWTLTIIISLGFVGSYIKGSFDQNRLLSLNHEDDDICLPRRRLLSRLVMLEYAFCCLGILIPGVIFRNLKIFKTPEWIEVDPLFKKLKPIFGYFNIELDLYTVLWVPFVLSIIPIYFLVNVLSSLSEEVLFFNTDHRETIIKIANVLSTLPLAITLYFLQTQ